MSIYYRSAGKPLPFAGVIAALPALGLREYPAREAAGDRLCITDGQDYLWIGTGDGSDTGFDHFNINCVREMLARFAKHFDTHFVSDRELESAFADEQAAGRLGYPRVPQAAAPEWLSTPEELPDPDGPGSKKPIPFARRTDLIDSSPIGVPMPELWERCKRFFYGRGEKRPFAQKAFQVYRRLVETHWERFSAAATVGDLITGEFFNKDDESFVRFTDLGILSVDTATARDVYCSLIFVKDGVVRFMGAGRPAAPIAAYQDRHYEKCIEQVLAGNGWQVKL
jgi:hypothetical protein